MRQATEQERQAWLEEADFVAPVVEVLTASLGGDRELAVKLESALRDADVRFAYLWAYFLRFLCVTDWLTVWDDFCGWLAAERSGIAAGYAVAEVEAEDELARLAEAYSDDDEEDF